MVPAGSRPHGRRRRALLRCLPMVLAASLALPALAQPPRLTDEALGRVIRERQAWQDNRLGITDRVPPPWHAVGAFGRTVVCWGRTYDYGGTLLPRQVTSAGQPILAGPMALSAVIAGRVVRFEKATRQTWAGGSDHVDASASAEAAGLRVRALSRVEYDGCVKVELSLANTGAPVVLDSLDLRIPVRRDRALYYHWFEATRDPKLTNAGALPAAGLSSHFKPLLWLGDDDRGFCWFGESPKGWAIRPGEPVLSVERTPGASTMRIRMATRPLVIAGTWSTVFGLMATPVRPMPTGWRDWLIPLNQTNPWSSWQPGFNNIGGTDDPGTLTPRDPPAMARWVKQTQERGWPVPLLPMREPTKVIPYSQVVFMSGKLRDGTPTPEVEVFGPEWSNQRQQPGPRRDPDDKIDPKEYWWVCPQSSYAQFYIYRLNQLIDSTGIDGIYIDGPWNTCANPLHGCGYQDSNGKWQPEYKIWAYRDLLKRVYCLFHQRRKDPVIHHHTSCWLCIPCLSFCDMMLDGEQYHDPGQKVEAHFMDVVPLDKWRAEHTGRQWGPAPFLLPDIPAKYCQDETATRELLMLTNLHDTGLFPAGDNQRAVLRNYQARRLFGVADCESRGYWSRPAWASCATPDCLVSAYRKPDHSRVLFVVGNTARADRVTVVRPDLSGLALRGAPPAACVDLETGERIPLQGGAITVPVKARDYRLLALPYYEAPRLTAGDVAATALKTVPNAGFEDGLTGWVAVPVEGNTGTVDVDTTVRFSGTASCHLHKVAGPGGVMVQTEDLVAVEPGRTYRLSGRLRIAAAAGPKAYWMVSQLDARGNIVGTNNLFGGFVTTNQDWTPLPFEFRPAPGAVAIRIHFLVAFPGTMDAWLDDVTLTPAR